MVFKVNGLSQTKTRKAAVAVFSDKTLVYNGIFGKTFDGEETLSALWDSGEIEKISPSSLIMEAKPRKNEPDPYEGMTERERYAEITGHTHPVDLRKDAKRFSLGLTQPTSKGQKVIEPNVIELRERFSNA